MNTAKPKSSRRRKHIFSSRKTKRKHKPKADDQLYAVRAIIEEKSVRGQLWYRIDWEDDPNTGEQFDPSWELAENATEEAVADWEERRLAAKEHTTTSHHPSSFGTDSQPVLQPNWRAQHRKRPPADSADSKPSRQGDRPQKRRQIQLAPIGPHVDSTDLDEDSSWKFAGNLPEKRGTLIVDVPGQPQFDPTEYAPVPTSSQLRDSPTSRQETEAISQRTIPDSQDFPDSVPSHATGPSDSQSYRLPLRDGHDDRASVDLLEVPVTSAATSQQAPDKASESSTGRAQPEPSGEAIPSRQPDIAHHNIPASQTIFETSQAAPADSSIDFTAALPAEFSGDTTSQDIDRGPSPPGQFLSQPDFGLGIPSLESSLPEPSGIPTTEIDSSAAASSSNPNLGSLVSRSVISDTSPHSAQVVQSIRSDPGDIRTQSQGESSADGHENRTPASADPAVVAESPVPHKTIQHSGGSNEDAPTAHHQNPIHESVPSTSASAVPSTVPGSSRFNSPNPDIIIHSIKAEDGAAVSERQTTPCYQPRYKPPAQYPSTPSPVSMDRASLDRGSPLSAVERFRKLQAEVYGQAQAQSSDSSTSPGTRSDRSPAFSPSPALPSRQSATHGEDHGHQIAQPSDFTRNLAMHSGHISEIPGSAIATLSDPAPPAVPPSAEVEEEPVDAVLPGIESHQSPSEMEPDSLLSNVTRPVTAGTNGYIVTLPMAASARAHYLEVIRTHSSTMTAYGDFFTTDTAKVPDEPLVSSMDDMFRRLFDLCDMPAFAESLPDMAPVAKKKHATGTNSKFSFVHELLYQIQDSNTRVLLVARPGHVLEYLEAVVATPGFSYSFLGRESATQGSSEKLAITIAGSDQDLSGIKPEFDLVILFDSAARSAELPRHFTENGDRMDGPIILSLVATCSIEHIDLRLSENMDSLERKNAVNFALVASQEIIRDPTRGGFMEPHEVAMIFAGLVNNPSEELDWEPQGIPDDLFDVYLSSQVPPRESLGGSVGRIADSAGSNSRKRLMDDVDEGTPKRARIAGTQEPAANRTPPVMSDLLRKILASRDSSGKASVPVEIPVQQLESMASEIALLSDRVKDKAIVETKLADHIKSLEVQLKSNEKSFRDMQPKYMEALRDRGVYEQERDDALEEARRATNRFETSMAETANLKEQNTLLETKLDDATALLGESLNPDIARLAGAGKELQEAKAKIESLEKKLESIQKDMDYSRDAYQRASTSASELGIENRELKERIKELEQLAGDNRTRLHQIHAQNESQEYRRQWEEQQAMVKDRERELDRVREEVRQLRSSRRETRHPSVPRSPRMGVMSPRVGRSAGGGTASRGTSPASLGGFDGSTASGMTFFNQVPGNGRWGHLRD